jgi:hypothetical protein
MSATVTCQFGNPDPNANPTSVADLVTLLNSLSLAEAVSGGPFTPYVISSTTPAVGDQDKAWLKTDGNGRPLGLFLFYSGNWRKFYSGNPSELRMFRGDPTAFFDNSGLGIIGSDWDGWAICNGNNGTDNWSDQFPVFGRMDNTPISGYNAGWQTNVTGGATKSGGSSTYAIKNTDLPNMKVQLTGDEIVTTNNNTPKTGVVTGKTDTSIVNTITLANFGSDPSGTPPVPQTAVPTLPPYRACCICQFVGY